jgi:chaperonin cofactor prefoldin
LWKREIGETMFENSTKKADKDLKRKKEKIELYIGRKK